MYNLTIFTSSFPYPSIEVGIMAIGIVIVGIIACRGGDSKLNNKVS